MELAVGMLTAVLILSAMFYIVRFIARSLEIENHLRRPGQSTYAGRIQLDDFAINRIFRMKALDIMEPRGETDRTIP